MKNPANPTIVEQIQSLRSMTVNQLREQYEEVFGEPTSARNKDYLWKKIAWRIQELEYGGLSERAKKRAREIANEHDIRVRPPRGFLQEATATTAPKAANKSSLPKPGIILTREYKGQRFAVEVMAKGFRFNGQAYRSLSAIAKQITGTTWNGNLFFNLKKQDSR